MSDSIKKYEEMKEQTKNYITEELIEERLTMKGFSEQESHDPEHVHDAVCKHFELTLTDEWKSGYDYYIYEDTTADGYEVFIATHDTNNISVSEHVYQYDSDLSELLQQAIIDADHNDAEIYVSGLNDNYSWVSDAMCSLYIELCKLYTDNIINELKDEGYIQEPASNVDLLNLIANNE